MAKNGTKKKWQQKARNEKKRTLRLKTDKTLEANDRPISKTDNRRTKWNIHNDLGIGWGNISDKPNLKIRTIEPRIDLCGYYKKYVGGYIRNTLYLPPILKNTKKTVNHGHPIRYYILGVKKSLTFFL